MCTCYNPRHHSTNTWCNPMCTCHNPRPSGPTSQTHVVVPCVRVINPYITNRCRTANSHLVIALHMRAYPFTCGTSTCLLRCGDMSQSSKITSDVEIQCSGIVIPHIMTTCCRLMCKCLHAMQCLRGISTFACFLSVY